VRTQRIGAIVVSDGECEIDSWRCPVNKNTVLVLAGFYALGIATVGIVYKLLLLAS